MRATIRADFRGFLDLDDEKQRSSLRRSLDVLTLPGFWAVVIYRLSAACHRAGLAPVARLLFLVNFVLFAVELSPRMDAGPGFVLVHPQLVALGAGVRFGRNVKVFRNVGMGTAGYRDKSRDGFPVIGDECMIFDSARIFGPVVVGAGSTIGSGVMLLDSVPPGSVVSLQQSLSIKSAADSSE